MADIEKVMNGLEHCLSRYVDGLCDDCPYMGAIDKTYMVPMKCKEIIMREAKEVIEEAYTTIGRCYSKIDKLLEAKQPRLLTLWEVSKAKYPEDVFCEIKDENRVFAVTAPVPIHWRAQPDIRYWTARPTDEQRKAEPWKDGEQE